MYEILIEDALLRQVIADRKAQFSALSIEDERRERIGRELTMLYLALAYLIEKRQREVERRYGPLPYE